MKKIVYLCGMMLLSMNMMAQIDPYDKNWIRVVDDEFNESNRQFDSTFQEPLGKWISFVPSNWPSGVTISNKELAIYQWNHCIFDESEGVLRINSEFIRDTAISCEEQHKFYNIPPTTYGITYFCNPDHEHLYYYSGCIESPPSNTTLRSDNLPSPRFRYGFFEIKCQVPIHKGAKSSFWLWDSMKDRYYEEIDVYEFSWSFEDSIATWHGNQHPHGAGNPFCFTSGMYINEDSSNIDSIELFSRARKYLMINDSLSHWHRFACEWLPEHVIWYCDGEIVDEYDNPDSIPSHAMTLKVGYSMDRYAMKGNSLDSLPEWKGIGSMVIDYINVYQLEWDCSSDAIIRCQTDYLEFIYKVKKSIIIASTNEMVEIRNTDKVTFRATDSFEITGPFQVDSGGELTVIMQQCPE